MSELTVLYDGACSLCRASVSRAQRFDSDRRIEFLDARDPVVTSRFPQVDRELALRSMHAVNGRGQVWSGVEAWARIGMLLPGWNMLAWVLLLPGVRQVGAKIYHGVARNRYRWNREACADGSCSLHLPKDSSGK